MVIVTRFELAILQPPLLISRYFPSALSLPLTGNTNAMASLGTSIVPLAMYLADNTQSQSSTSRARSVQPVSFPPVTNCESATVPYPTLIPR